MAVLRSGKERTVFERSIFETAVHSSASMDKYSNSILPSSPAGLEE